VKHVNCGDQGRSTFKCTEEGGVFAIPPRPLANSISRSYPIKCWSVFHFNLDPPSKLGQGTSTDRHLTNYTPGFAYFSELHRNKQFSEDSRWCATTSL
jgi:hypothetical protein